MNMPKMPSDQALETLRVSIKDMTDADLAVLVSVVQGERLYRLDQKRYTLRVGNKYKFTDKVGREIEAVLVKIAPKNCKLVQAVKDEAGLTMRNINWTVHPSFLKV